MGLIGKIKLLWKAVGFFKEIAKGGSMKAGIKTTEFWGKIFVQVIALAGALKGVLDPELATLIVAVLEGLYGIFRSVVKYKGGNLPDA